MPIGLIKQAIDETLKELESRFGVTGDVAIECAPTDFKAGIEMRLVNLINQHKKPILFPEDANRFLIDVGLLLGDS